MQTIAHDNDAIESEAGLGTVPGNELVNSELVDPTRSWGAEAVEHGSLAVI
jgi:hypothetical protein